MKNSRRIGKNFELEIANWLKRWWPDAARSYGQSRRGSDAADVEHTPYWIECKSKQYLSDNAIDVIWQKAYIESDHRKPIIIYNIKSKGNRKTGGKSYIRAAMHIDVLKKLEFDANNWEPDKHRLFGYKQSLVEVDLEYLGFLFDLVYGVEEVR